jgi:outer membrane protein assembly factor BamB
VRDTKTGNHLWSRSASVEPVPASAGPEPGDPTLAVLARGTVAVSGATIGERAATVAFDSVTGRTLWSSMSATLRGLDQSGQAATATSDMLPVNAGGPALADAHNGRILWRAPGHTEEASGNRALVAAAPAQDATISVDGQVPRPGRCS